MADYIFPLIACSVLSENLITSYSIKPIENEISLKCGKYEIKRPKRSVKVYEVEIAMNDLQASYVSIIKSFFSIVFYSKFFNFTVESITFSSKFKSFKIDNSDLHDRQNVTFSLIGSII